jgi:hypothetical protein
MYEREPGIRLEEAYGFVKHADELLLQAAVEGNNRSVAGCGPVPWVEGREDVKSHLRDVYESADALLDLVALHGAQSRSLVPQGEGLINDDADLVPGDAESIEAHPDKQA